jgi:ADP-ribose pyrophosphatase
VSFPRILSRTRTVISPWVDLVEKVVQFGPEQEPASYHCLAQAAYVGVLVQTDDRRIPIVRQYRPAVEDYTWELPAGTLDSGDTPQQAAYREVLEETGLSLSESVYLGNFYPDTGRIQVDSHAFFGRAPRALEGFRGEDDLTVRYVTHQELKQMIATGEFRHQIHLAIYGTVRALDIELD